MNRFKGLGTALVTPFREGVVDYEAFRKMVERQTDAGVDFLVPLGSTAETPCLEDSEKIMILDIAKEMSRGLPVVAGVGTNSLRSTISNMALLSAADAFLVVVPYYNKPVQRGLYEYFTAVAASTDKPVILYNVPGRTGTNMTAETVLRLAEIPNIVAVKEASGNIAQILEIKRSAPDDFSVLSGNDDETLPLMASGADGVISVASNVAPKEMAEVVKAVRQSDLRKAIALNNRLMPLYHACFVESNPIPVKAALSLLGLCTSEMRLPLTKATDGTVELLREVLSEGKYSE